jgi:RNA polymerase sigma factor (sigma-70 family)
MVLGVCRRILRYEQDAQDAFQATFFVLVRKAASVLPRDRVGNWLFGVAQRTAIRVRAMNAKRSEREKQVMEMPDVVNKECRDDLTPLLDQELSHLPEMYRTVIILCDLEGRTRKEVGKQLGWPEGSVSTRLSRGRAMLAKRLAKHGLMLSGEALAVSLAQNIASACLPPSLVLSTVKAATLIAASQSAATTLVSAKVAAITQGVLTSMFLTKLKTAVMVSFIVCVLGIGAGSFLSGQTPDEVVQRKVGGSRKDLPTAKNLNEQELKLADLQRRLEQAQAQYSIAQAHYQQEIANVRTEIESMKNQTKMPFGGNAESNTKTRMFSPHNIDVQEVVNVLESLFNPPGQPQTIRIAMAHRISTIIIQGRADDLERVAAMIEQLEDRARQRREAGFLRK